MTKSRIFLFLLIAFVAGVAIASFISFSIYFVLVFLILAAVTAIIGILRENKNIIVGGFVLLFFSFGAFWLNFKTEQKPDLNLLYGKPLTFYGVVYEEAKETTNSQQLRIKITKIDESGFKNFFRIIVVTRRYPEFFVGDELKLKGLLERPENFNNFDYEAHLAKDDIYGTILFPDIENIGRSDSYGLKFALILSKIKSSFEENISRILPEPEAAFLKGILLGSRETLPQSLTEDFRKTGTSHIVALSGYNITILSRVVIAVLLFLYIPFRFSFWIASGFIFLFVLLTGASASVVRAAIMGVLVLLARREGRLYNMTNALIFAGAVMIFQNPKILKFDAGFQLSFLATAGLVYLAPSIESFFDGISDKIKEFVYGKDYPKKIFVKEMRLKQEKPIDFKKILIETLSAQIMVLPLLIYLFGHISVISPIANIFVLAAMPYSMLFGFLTGASGFLFDPLALFFGWISWALATYQIEAIEFFAKLPVASFSVGNAVLIFILIIYIAVLFRLFKGRILTRLFLD